MPPGRPAPRRALASAPGGAYGDGVLQGIHHVTAITGDARGSVRFHVGVLGLRLVKKTVNHDEPGVYHLYFGDEDGRPRTLLTLFEVPGAAPGQPGGGMFHSVIWRVPGTASLDFWDTRLHDHQVAVERSDERLLVHDPEGLVHVLVAGGELPDDRPAEAAGVPQEHALREIIGVDAISLAPERSRTALVEGLGMADLGGVIACGSGDHVGRVRLHPEATSPGMSGGGTIHHVAFASPDADHRTWQTRLDERRLGPTQIVDRIYFRSIYLREPGGLLVEVASMGPGMAVDEDPQALGESLALPTWLEPHRPAIEDRLTPLDNPRLAR